MAQKVTDITARTESPRNQEKNLKPEQTSPPVDFEVAREVAPEKFQQASSEGKIEAERREIGSIGQPVTVTPPTGAKSPVLQKIEKILEEDLEQIYFQMPPQKQAEFARKGEETASKIKVNLEGAKFQAKKILELIIDWLKIIPRVNKYFLEQEAKIKTDELLKLKGNNSSKNQPGVSDQNRI